MYLCVFSSGFIPQIKNIDGLGQLETLNWIVGVCVCTLWWTGGLFKVHPLPSPYVHWRYAPVELCDTVKVQRKGMIMDDPMDG